MSERLSNSTRVRSFILTPRFDAACKSVIANGIPSSCLSVMMMTSSSLDSIMVLKVSLYSSRVPIIVISSGALPAFAAFKTSLASIATLHRESKNVFMAST